MGGCSEADDRILNEEEFVENYLENRSRREAESRKMKVRATAPSFHRSLKMGSKHFKNVRRNQNR